MVILIETKEVPCQQYLGNKTLHKLKKWTHYASYIRYCTIWTSLNLKITY